MPDEPDGSGGLTPGEIALLRRYGDAVRAARPGRDRNLARTVALNAAAEVRLNGASWRAIGIAVGFQAETLRRWRRRAPKPAVLPRRGMPAGAGLASSPAEATGFPERVMLHTMGHPRPGGNDFATEAATIRGHLKPLGIDVHEHSCLELAEIPELLDERRPLIFQLSAHSTFAGVELALGLEPSTVSADHILSAVRQAVHRPTLAVLNYCDSGWTAERLAAIVASTVGWHGQVTDEQALLFAGHLYRGLGRSRTLDASFAAALLTLQARWNDQLRPALFGTTGGRRFAL